MSRSKPVIAQRRAVISWVMAGTALGLSGFSPSAWAQPVQELHVCMTDVPHAPWRVPGPNGLVRGDGLDFQLLRDFERLSNWSVKVSILSGRRCFAELQLGRADATVGLSYTPERANYLRYPMLGAKPNPAAALRTDAYVLYRRPGSAVQWDGRTLSLPPDTKVGAQAGHSIAQWLRDAGHPVHESVRSAEQVLRAVAADTLPAAALLVGEGEALRQGDPALGALERVEPPLLVKPYFVVFSSTFAQAHEASLPRLWRQFATAAQRNPAYVQAARSTLRPAETVKP